jgi:transposase
MTFKHRGGGIMVWTCFSGGGVGPFHKINGIMDRFIYKDILDTKMLPYAEWNMPLRWVFQHDNDPKHSSKLVKDYLQDSGIQVLDWPAQSPDLNPIENLFGILKRSVSGQRFRKKEDLFEALKVEWNNIPQTIINNLILSMPRRCAEVMKNKGFYTKY